MDEKVNITYNNLGKKYSNYIEDIKSLKKEDSKNTSLLFLY